jgi:hypothetical protein
MARACSNNGYNRNSYKVLVANREKKRTLVRRIRKWEGNIRVDIRGIERVGMDWIDLGQDRDQWNRAVVSTVMNLRVP